jgi:peptide/nickel transport system substrate-binding protein
MRKRWFVILAVVLIAVLVACRGTEPTVSTPIPAPTATQVAEVQPPQPPTTTGFSEAPMLASLVAAGQLPPVEERLPVADDVFVVTPTESVGKYGGTWYAVSWAADIPNIKMKLYDPPIRWQGDYTGYEPGLAKSFDWSADGTEVTLRFRDGVRWSDGAPFTTADLRFWWEDLANDADYRVNQVPWWGFKSDGSTIDMSFPDDYTMVMKWDTPQWITPYILAQGFWEWEPLMKPRHYLEQFHPKYTSTSDYDTLERMDKWWENPDYPVLYAWHVVRVIPAERVILERNPYYWKVDTAGNQLPYIDTVDISIVPEKEVRVLQLSQGKYNASFRGTDDPRDIPFLLEQAAGGNYRVASGWMNGAGGWPCWLINQNYVDDEEIRALLRDKNFRQGISFAMNRDRLVDVVWEGIGTPQQATISPQSWHFASAEGQRVFEEWADAHAEYDPGKANELLDAAGLVDRNGDGWRDLPSGQRFELILDLGGWGGAEVSTEATEVFQGNLEAVGIQVFINNLIDQPGWDLRQTEGQYMLRNCHASEVDIWTYPDWIFPLRDNRAWPMEGKWRQTGGAEGERPEAGGPAERLQAIYDQGVNEPDEQRRHQLVWDAIRIHIEEGPFTLGAAGDQPMPVVIANNFRNVPENGILGPWAPGSPGNMHPAQFWIDE